MWEDTSESFRDVLFWTALKLSKNRVKKFQSFRDVLFWTALKQKEN